MTSKIQKWGNSLAIRIPRNVALETQLKAGYEVDLSVDNGKIVITATKCPIFQLEELLKDITEENIHAEISTANAVGNEVW